jgi:hypothetical protein
MNFYLFIVLTPSLFAAFKSRRTRLQHCFLPDTKLTNYYLTDAIIKLLKLTSQSK